VHLALLLAALIFSGAVQALESPPLNWWLLHPVSFVPAILALSTLRGGRALLGGWLIGIAANMAIFYWVVHTVRSFSNLPLPAAIACLLAFSLFWGFYAGIWGWGFHAVKERAGDWWPIGIAAWFAACEYLNPQLFPYYQGVSFYQVPRVFLVTAVAGVPYMTFCILLCNGVVAQGILRQRAGEEKPWSGPVLRNGAVLLALVLFAFGYSAVRLGKIEAAEAEAETSRIALVQTNLDVFTLRRLSRESKTASLDAFLDLSKRTWGKDPDIDAFVWPEGALRGAADYRRNRPARRFVAESGVELWSGGSFSKRGDDGRRVHYNSAFRVHRGGKIGPRYDKNILLPFGEFMPLEDLLPILKKIQGVGNYNAGDGLHVYETPHGNFVFLICYEAIRHRYVRGGVREGADLLVNITYDAWFGDTSNPTQHLMLSAIQSAQFGMPLVRAATTGISAHVDARGVIVQETDVFTEDVLIADVKRVDVPSPYRTLGDWFVWLCVLGSGLLLLLGQAGERTWGRGAWFGWGVIAVGTLMIPKLAWLANPYVLVGDWLCWAYACAAVIGVGVLAWRRRAPAPEETP